MEAEEQLAAALDAHGELLAEELRRLADLPQVRIVPSSVFDRAKPLGSVAQARGVVVKLRCCKKPLDQKCNNLSGVAACPTFIEAARLLRLKVQEKHGSEECLAKACEHAESTRSEGTSTSINNDAFARLMEGQLAIQRARSALTHCEKKVSTLRAILSDAQASLHQVVLFECWGVVFMHSQY